MGVDETSSHLIYGCDEAVCISEGKVAVLGVFNGCKTGLVTLVGAMSIDSPKIGGVRGKGGT
jgi:hypothetical protein